MGHSGARVSPPALQRVRPREADCVLMQAARLLPLLRRPAHGGNRRPPGRLRDPAGPGAPMGALVADPAAPFVRRSAAAARAAVAGDPPRHCQLSGQASGAIRNRADTGAVTLIQRFGSAANLNIHLHCLVLDGVYLNRDGVPVFHEAAAPSTDELGAVLRKIITRTMRILTRLGALIEEPERSYLAETETDGALRSLQAASWTLRILYLKILYLPKHTKIQS